MPPQLAGVAVQVSPPAIGLISHGHGYCRSSRHFQRSTLPLRTSTVRMTAFADPSPSRRFAVLKTGNATDYTERTYGGYARMLERLLADGTGVEQWDIFSVIDGDFSFLDRPEAYEGYVITGSGADAHSDEGWVLRLRDALALLHGHGRRLLGVCFGHQILARALGGKTGRAEAGWELGIKRLQVDSGAVAKLYGVELPADIYAIESHQDQVSQVPPGSVIIASSAKTSIEMFALGENVLGVQCHPEFTNDVILDIIQSRMSRNIINPEVANEAIQSLESNQADQESLRILCKKFLKG